MYVNVPWTDTNTNLSTEQVQDIVGAMVSSNSESNISVTYDDTNGKLNFAPSSVIKIGNGIELKESTDRADLLEIKGLTSGWAGIQIKNNTTEHLFSLMSDGSTFGLYDDQQNEWAWQYTENAGHQFRYNNVVRLSTNSAGATVSGTTATSLSGMVQMLLM